MKIVKDKTIFDIKKNNRPQPKWGGQYPHVVDNKIYYELGNPNEVRYVKLVNDSITQPENNIVLQNSLATNNFKVFIDTNPNIPQTERYKAIGGYHVSRNHAELVGLMETQKAQQKWCFDPVWPKESKEVIKDDMFHPRHGNGLYVFTSPDGINWTEYYKGPIFSRFTQCADSKGKKLPEGTIGCDYMPSAFFDHNINEYIIYIRANIALGCRHVLYSKSKDLINWSTPQLISCDPAFDIENKQNFYYPAVYPLNNKYIAFPPHFYNQILDEKTGTRSYHDQCTHVMISNDGFNWKKIDQILESQQKHHMEFPHVVSFSEDNDNYVLYVHEGFGTPDNKLVKYMIHKEELEHLL